MIHYHGLPITPATAARAAISAGHAFVSFRYPDQLAAAIAQKITPSTPLNKTPWDADECAAYHRVSNKTFIQSYASNPGYPRPIRVSTTTGRGHPRWLAQEVIDWTLNNRTIEIKRRKPKQEL